MSVTSSDKAFLDRLSRGTPSSAAELDRRYRQRLCRLVERELNRSLRSREDPEDVVQTVFRTYFRRAALGEFRIASTNDLWALLAKITRNKILKRVEYHRSEKRSIGDETRLPPELPGDRDPGPVDAAIAAEFIAMTLEGLEPNTVQVFQLHIAGCTEMEIAEQLDCTRAEVRMRIQQIRCRLSRVGATDLEK